MTLKNANVPDATPGSGFMPILARASRTVEAETSMVQVFDQWADGEDWISLQAVGNVTLPVLSTTIGWRTVMSYLVPAGKIFIPSWVSCNSAGTLNTLVRVARRYHLWAFAGAALGTPVANVTGPSITTNKSTGMNIGVYSYKFTVLNNVGETLPTAASANVTTTAATDGISLPLPTGVAGALYLRIYRTVAGGATYFLLHELDGAVAGYTDTHPDSDLNQSVTPPGSNTTAGSVSGADNPPLTSVSEIVFHVERVVLSASPAVMIYTDEDGLQESTTTTITLTADTQTLVPLKRADIGLTGLLDAIPRTKAANFRGGQANHGLREVKFVSGNPATGQYNVYGYGGVLRGETKPTTAAPLAGTLDALSVFTNPVAFPAGAEIVVDLAHPQGIIAAAAVRIVNLVGRLIAI